MMSANGKRNGLNYARRTMFLFVANLCFTFLSGSAFAIGSGVDVLADQYEAKSSVFIFFGSKDPSTGNTVLKPRCSGVLVGADLVMTAHHCVINISESKDQSGNVKINKEPVSADSIFVYFSLSYPIGSAPKPTLLRPVKDYRTNPIFLTDGDQSVGLIEKGDIALLKLALPAPSTYTPAAIDLDPATLVQGEGLTIAGYGRVYDSGDPREPKTIRLRSFDTLIYNPVSTRFDYAGLIQLYHSQDLPRFKEKYSSGTDEQRHTIENAGERAGDSGGPAYVIINGKPYVAGIASGYDDQLYPTYENVPNDSDWLLKAAVELGSPL
jgi:Trypsin